MVRKKKRDLASQLRTTGPGGLVTCATKDCNNGIAPDRKHCVSCLQKRRAYSRRQLLLRYGLTEETYEAMRKSQRGKCALCRRLPRGRLQCLVVDHDHATGRIRALLCDQCNRALGMFRDDPALMRRAASYVKKHKVSTVVEPKLQPPAGLSEEEFAELMRLHPVISTTPTENPFEH